MVANGTKIKVKDYGFYYGSNKVLGGISMEIPENTITALIGPS
ncbi:MAG: phosphate ABC transporter ATP-binding protein, partial [Actinomycetota bacterium]